jgi:hypothetical protein
MNCDCLNDKNINEYIVVKFKILFDDTYLDWQTEKILRMACFSAKIYTGHLLNRKQEY